MLKIPEVADAYNHNLGYVAGVSQGNGNSGNSGNSGNGGNEGRQPLGDIRSIVRKNYPVALYKRRAIKQIDTS